MQKPTASYSQTTIAVAPETADRYAPSCGLEGALIAADTSNDGKIAVLYNRGETPPQITITQDAGQIQTVHANGVAVAIVAQAQGCGITPEDVLLVERFVHQAS